MESRRNYSNVFNACARIAREEGVTKLWRGSVPTMVRAAMLNLGMLATYD
jgi:solute carrier family 25 oxoglutarate transporter 11